MKDTARTFTPEEIRAYDEQYQRAVAEYRAVRAENGSGPSYNSRLSTAAGKVRSSLGLPPLEGPSWSTDRRTHGAQIPSMRCRPARIPDVRKHLTLLACRWLLLCGETPGRWVRPKAWSLPCPKKAAHTWNPRSAVAHTRNLRPPAHTRTQKGPHPTGTRPLCIGTPATRMP